MKILIIGGVAGGATAAARLRRLDEQAEIIVLERSGYVSYANCGLPYYIGGAIAPGIRISMDALTARAAKLSSISLEAPQHTIGRNTVEAVRSGTVVGAAAMAEGLVARIKDELGEPSARVIATGGLAGLVAACTNVFDVIDQQLTLKGICEICRRLQA